MAQACYAPSCSKASRCYVPSCMVHKIDRREVVLERGKSGYGLKITSNEDEMGVRIEDITPGGIADRSGNVFKNDVILEVNGVNMLAAKHDDVVNALKATNVVRLVLSQSLPTKAVVPDNVSLQGQSARPPPTYSLVSSLSQTRLVMPEPKTPVLNSVTEDRSVDDGSDKESEDLAMMAAVQSNRRLVKMSRRTNGFGMKIRSDPGIRGVRVSDVSKGGAAEAIGNVFVGDYILEINNVPMLHASHDDVVAALLKSSDVLLLLGTEHDANVYAAETLSASRPGQLHLTNHRTVTLRKTATGLGLKIKAEEPGRGIRIVEVTSGGAADKSGQVAIGDIIVSINGMSMLDVPQMDIIEALTAVKDECILVLAQEEKQERRPRRSFMHRLSQKLFNRTEVATKQHPQQESAIPEEALQALHELATIPATAPSTRRSASGDGAERGGETSARTDALVARLNRQVKALEEDLGKQRELNSELLKAHQQLNATKEDTGLKEDLVTLRMRLIDIEFSRVAEKQKLQEEISRLRDESTRLADENSSLKTDLAKLRAVQELIRSIQENEETTETSA